MAVVRARTGPSISWGGLSAIVTLTVIFAVAAGAMYYLWSSGRADQQDAAEKLARVASDADIRNAAVAPTGGPVLRQVLERNQQLREIIMGAKATGNVENIKSDPTVSAALNIEQNSDHSLVGAIKHLTAANEQEATDLAAANNRAKSATEARTAAERDVKKLTDSYEATIAQLQDQLKTLQAQVADANAARDKVVADDLDKTKQMQQEQEDKSRNLVLQNQDLQTKVATLQKDVQDLKEIIRVKSGSGDKTPTVAQADGSVLHVNAAGGEVYISLTAADHIKPGMTFTCYDPRIGVHIGNDEEAKGNGTIEVTQVRSDSSLCRITSTTPGHTILQGDLIFNVVYHNDTSRKFHFVVFGDFDLDGDGVATAAERDRLISMINTWGGQVDNNVTAQTDYVVMGTRPAAPTIVEDNSAATAPGSIAAQRASDDTRYDQIIKDGKDLGIPVLNANRFLSLIGYYSTTIVRY